MSPKPRKRKFSVALSSPQPASRARDHAPFSPKSGQDDCSCIDLRTAFASCDLPALPSRSTPSYQVRCILTKDVTPDELHSRLDETTPPSEVPSTALGETHQTEDPQSHTFSTDREPSIDEGYGEDDSQASCMSSIPEAHKQHEHKDGRLYETFAQNQYILPIDDAEKERMELEHIKYLLLLHGQLFLAPIKQDPQRILDLGTGTGLWAIDVSDAYPSAEVIGVDVAHRIMPISVPSNCLFELMDMEAHWPLQKNLFDLIHGRDLSLVVRSWEKLMTTCLEHLKSGGWLELSCTDLCPGSESGIPKDSKFQSMCETLTGALKTRDIQANYGSELEHHFRQAGFDSIHRTTFSIPTCPWPHNEPLKLIGKFQKRNLSLLGPAFGRMLNETIGWTQQRTHEETARFWDDAVNQQHKYYLRHYVVYGQKPVDP